METDLFSEKYFSIDGRNKKFSDSRIKNSEVFKYLRFDGSMIWMVHRSFPALVSPNPKRIMENDSGILCEPPVSTGKFQRLVVSRMKTLPARNQLFTSLFPFHTPEPELPDISESSFNLRNSASPHANVFFGYPRFIASGIQRIKSFTIR